VGVKEIEVFNFKLGADCSIDPSQSEHTFDNSMIILGFDGKKQMIL